MSKTFILLYILFGCCGIIFIAHIIKLFKLKIWIRIRNKRHKLEDVGYLKHLKRSGDAADVFISGVGKRHPVGHVVLDEDGRGNVEISTDDILENPENAKFRRFGYIDEDGYIYKQTSLKNKPEVIGYTARPSRPNEPTIYGKRSWTTLWRVKTLNAYLGKPADNTDNASDSVNPSDSTKKTKNRRKRRKKRNGPIAVCYQKGYRSTRKDPIPAEARACAFAVFFSTINRKKYAEYYKSPSYAWRDTALLASLVYGLLYLILYAVSKYILGHSVTGNDMLTVAILTAFYYILWAIVRALKIRSIENGNSIQARLDMLNKALGQRIADIFIIFLAGVAMVFAYLFRNYDFLPLLWSIGFGMAVNFTLRRNRIRWKVLTTFQEEDEDAEELKLPEGDIARTYEWSLDSTNYSKENCPSGNLTLYFSAEEMADIRKANPFFAQRRERSYKEYIQDMFYFLKEHPAMLLRTKYIKEYIVNTAKQHLIQDELDVFQFVLDFVQEPNIKFTLNQDSKSIDQFHDYIRFPDETLYDKEGDCNSKTLLAVMLFHLMGHNTLYLFSRKQQHSALAIELTPELEEKCLETGNIESVEFNGQRYLFCETTGDTFRVGQTMPGMKIDDFEDKIEILADADGDTENGTMNVAATRLYHWDLDPVSDPNNKLQGSLALEFNTEEMSDLRSRNPFHTYGADGNSYEQNIRFIFNYIFDDDDRMRNVKAVVNYICESIEKASYPEIDKLQFALDFAQEPNIHYNIDENSSGIGFAKEYMRFPDEVLFDKEGDCDCKSSLTCALFHAMGYNVIFLLGATVGHAAVGVELNEQWLDSIKPEVPENVIREYNGRRYIYCETTGDGNKIGHINDNESIQNFETVVEIPA